MRNLYLVGAVTLGALALGGCGDDSTGSGGGTGGGATSADTGATTATTSTGAATTGSEGSGGSATASVAIVAAEGGTVELGDATLVVPPDALEADTTIVGEARDTSGSPDAVTLRGAVYDFGPDGTAFDPAATLIVQVNEEPGDDERVVLSWLDGSEWVDLPTTVEGGEASAPVEHFTDFALRVVPASTVEYPDELGFEFDGNFYPLDPNNDGCGDAGDGRFFVNQSNPGDAGAVTAYVVFGGLPTPGTYVVNEADGQTPPPAGEASVWFNEQRDSSDLWYSDGGSGVVDVVDAGGGAIDVVWHDVSLIRGEGSITIEPGSTTSSLEGWQVCEP